MQRAMEEAGLPSAKFELGKDQTFKVIFDRPKNVSQKIVKSDLLAELPFMEKETSGSKQAIRPVFNFNVPLSDPSEFYGRVREIETLLSRVQYGASTSIVGPRRMGKTWLIYYLMQVAPSKLGQRFRIAYVDATTYRCSTVNGFTDTAIESLGFPSHQANQGLLSLETVVEEMLSKNYIPVLCIDEFEGFSDRQTFDLNFFSALRAMTQAGLSLVVASKSPLIDIVGEHGKTSGFFNIFAQITLKPFTRSDAVKFVKDKAIAAGFTSQESDRLLEYGQIENQWSPVRLQLVGLMLHQDKNLAILENDLDYYRPEDPSYWQDFEMRLKETYRGIVR